VTQITLHFAPDSCSRVPLIALEEIGHPFKLELVVFARGDHRSLEYRSLNPKGKVPTLVVDGRPLSENVAILSWLAEHFPRAGLLPAPTNSLERAGVLADLAFCASGLHPIVTRLRLPQMFCDIEGAPPRVFAMAEAAIAPSLALVNHRLSQGRWWYGTSWSVLDAYLNWVWFRVVGAGLDPTPYPNLARHDADMLERPAVQRALAYSREASDLLEAQGLAVRFSGPGAVAAPR
jgi:glutathione S-transferase